MHVERDSRVEECNCLKRPHCLGKLVVGSGLLGLSQEKGYEDRGPAALG